MRLSEKTKPALVLSGGGVKAAAFHIGVCLALQEKGFRFAGGSPDRVKSQYPEDRLTFKTYVGSSAGSVVSTFLACGYSVDSIINAFTISSVKILYFLANDLDFSDNTQVLDLNDSISKNLEII